MVVQEPVRQTVEAERHVDRKEQSEKIGELDVCAAKPRTHQDTRECADDRQRGGRKLQQLATDYDDRAGQRGDCVQLRVQLPYNPVLLPCSCVAATPYNPPAGCTGCTPARLRVRRSPAAD